MRPDLLVPGRDPVGQRAIQEHLANRVGGTLHLRSVSRDLAGAHTVVGLDQLVKFARARFRALQHGSHHSHIWNAHAQDASSQKCYGW